MRNRNFIPLNCYWARCCKGLDGSKYRYNGQLLTFVPFVFQIYNHNNTTINLAENRTAVVKYGVSRCLIVSDQTGFIRMFDTKKIVETLGGKFVHVNVL